MERLHVPSETGICTIPALASSNSVGIPKLSTHAQIEQPHSQITRAFALGPRCLEVEAHKQQNVYNYR